VSIVERELEVASEWPCVRMEPSWELFDLDVMVMPGAPASARTARSLLAGLDRDLNFFPLSQVYISPSRNII